MCTYIPIRIVFYGRRDDVVQWKKTTALIGRNNNIIRTPQFLQDNIIIYCVYIGR
jgi:hypothetical protein